MRSAVASLAILVIAISACGERTSQTRTRGGDVVERFDDGAGVARLSATLNGEPFDATVMAPDVRRISADRTGPMNLTNVEPAGSNAHGDFVTGRATINGESVDVVLYEDARGVTAIVSASGDTTNLLMAGGDPVRNVPSGTFTYEGTNVYRLRAGSTLENGTFRMDVDFDARRARIDGSTANTRIEGSGIPVNTSRGTFDGSGATLTVNGESLPASISGRFHGDGATGVSGLYHDTAGNPVHAGAIAGTR